MKADSVINVQKLAAALKTKRAGRALRYIADDIGGVSASTLSRIEQGSLPDLPSFLRICAWLQMPADNFVDESLELKKAHRAEIPLPDEIETRLRSDSVLSNSTVTAISEMIRVAYRDAANRRKKDFPKL